MRSSSLARPPNPHGRASLQDRRAAPPQRSNPGLPWTCQRDANLNELLEQARLELEASADTPQFIRKITVERIREITRTMLEHFPGLHKQLETELSADRSTQRLAQEALARALVVGRGRGGAPRQRDLGDLLVAELEQLTPSVAADDTKLLGWAKPLFGHDPTLSKHVDEIARGTGRRDSAQDVLRLATMYRTDWARISTMNIISEEELDKAEADATRLLELLEGTASNPSRELAARAYSRWHRDYRDMYRTARYISEGEPDVVARFPGIRMPSLAAARVAEPPAAAPPAAAPPVAEPGS